MFLGPIDEIIFAEMAGVTNLTGRNDEKFRRLYGYDKKPDVRPPEGPEELCPPVDGNYFEFTHMPKAQEVFEVKREQFRITKDPERIEDNIYRLSCESIFTGKKYTLVFKLVEPAPWFGK